MKGCILFLVVASVKAQYSSEEYSYDNYAEDEAAEADTGQRLVGASKAKEAAYPWVIGYNLFSIEDDDGTQRDYTACTGSLITTTWIVSAAHCISAMAIPEKNISACIEKTNHGEFFKRSNGFEVSCQQIQNGNTKIQINNTIGIAYFGVVDVNNPKEVAAGIKIEIDYMIWHAKSYKGGGAYGTYGGYDISLLRLKDAAPSRFMPACLPGANFKDNAIGAAYNSKQSAGLAGFGKFFRTDKGKKKCQTDEFGKSKQHYCAKEGNSGCITDKDPPQVQACQRFFAAPKTPDSVPEDEEETILRTKTGIHYCYHKQSPKKGSRGWCEVKKNAASALGRQRTLRRKNTSWGFCGKDCYLDDNKHGSSVLRFVEDVDILDEGLCDEFLESTLRSTVEYKPRILCIGFKKTIKYTMWKERKDYSGHFSRINPEHSAFKDFRHPMTVANVGQSYIYSAGTCKGDSGGPVFTKDDDTGKFVVLGSVSGGRGVLRACGGINNPTHYTRLKYFGKWIQDILGSESEDLCFIGGPARDL